MHQEESGFQQSECTKFPNALYHSFTFNICAEKTRATAFCHQAQRDAHFPFQNSFSALFCFLREKFKCGVSIYSQLTHCASLQVFIRCSMLWKAFSENKAAICKCILKNVSGYHKIVLEWQSFGHCVKSYRRKLWFRYGYSNYEQYRWYRNIYRWYRNQVKYIIFSILHTYFHAVIFIQTKT